MSIKQTIFESNELRLEPSRLGRSKTLSVPFHSLGSVPGRNLTRRISRALSSHVKPHYLSSLEQQVRSRARSSGSFDSVLRESSSSEDSTFDYQDGLSLSPKSIKNPINSYREFQRGRRQHRQKPTSASSRHAVQKVERGPSLFLCQGRRFIDNPACTYSLPSDLREYQRQDLLCMFLNEVLEGPTCVPIDPRDPPQSVLDVGCGSGFWASTMHDHYVDLGINPPKFTGIDLYNLAGNLKAQGIDWTFVQHDAVKLPFPFPDESFDHIRFGETGMVFPYDLNWYAALRAECLRLLKPRGRMEIRCTDSLIRRVLPSGPKMSAGDEYQCCDGSCSCVGKKMGCYPINNDTKFAESENHYIKQRNYWIGAWCKEHNKCATVLQLLSMFQSVEDDSDRSLRRVAIPMSNMISCEHQYQRWSPTKLSVRSMALELVIREMESYEPMFKEYSRMLDTDWSMWWNDMVEDMMEHNGCAGGECIEAGDWWMMKPDRTDARLIDLAEKK
jgi:ubiquinone/menaquinone biosynthesis C-methylase UbiE